jgi:hypothetical protein
VSPIVLQIRQVHGSHFGEHLPKASDVAKAGELVDFMGPIEV